jgi:FixJ family two-component response regulator
MSVQAMKNGATDFLTKPVDETALLEAVRQSLLRHQESLHARLATVQDRTAAASLTPREFDVMRCVLSGARNKQIAIHLGITEKTVKIHRGQVMKKMGVGSVANLVRVCECIGIAPEPLS